MNCANEIVSTDAGGALRLVETAEGLQLVADNGLSLKGDFMRMLPRLKPSNLARELVVRASKVKGASDPWVVDATAGLGEDSLLLAASGFRVTLFERDPVIAALLADALERARVEPELHEAASRMTLVEGDSVVGLASLEQAPDVVLLDPMFPVKQKSGAVKKKLQMLQMLEKPCEDEQALLDAAFDARPRKVVVKRPKKGPYLAGLKPNYSLSGKAIRYDCHVLAR